ncbi:MAG: hypothetical protein LBR15_07840 [Methanobrevibacter sp.]|jgi:putative transposase|nr:hypothetical protein [Candidatus Methanovirga australis]
MLLSKTSVNHVSEFCPDAPCEGTVRYRLRNLELDTLQQNLNDNLKIHAVKTVSRKYNEFAIDFVNIPFLW